MTQGNTKGWLAWRAVAMVCLCLLSVASAVGVSAQTTLPATGPAGKGANTRAVVIHITGGMDDFVKEVVLGQLEQARKSGAGAVIFHLDTPGGALGPTLEMTRAVRSVTDVRTIAYINPIAYSAGTIFAVACDEIYMGPESALGDCAPIAVTQTGLQTLGDAERAKLSSPVVADMYASAERNGHDGNLLAAMVLPGRVIHVVVNEAGERRFVDPPTYAKLIQEGWKVPANVPDPLDAADTLVTLDNRLSERVGLSRGTYASVDALASAKGLTIEQRFEPTFGQTVVQFLNSAAVRGLLATAFMISMYLSFQTPGHGLPEAVCLTSLATLLIVPLLTGYASWIEISMILIGIALIALEIFVLTGTLVPGLVGVAMVLTGLVMTFVPRELPTAPGEWTPPSMPSLPGTWAALQTGFVVMGMSLVASVGLGMVIARFLPSLPVGNRLVLPESAGGGVGLLAGGRVEVWPPVGAVAVTTTVLMPGGNAEFDDPDGPGKRTVAVVSDSGYVDRGAKVKVLEVEGARVLVRAVREAGQV